MIKKFQISNGFTLVELLVVVAVLAVVGSLILVIFTSTLRGNNKSQIISIIKQNGQSVMDIMDKTIRNSDGVICLSNTETEPTLVIEKDGLYTRYKFVPTTSNFANRDCGSKNGCILQDNPILTEGENLDVFEASLCVETIETPEILTDTDLKTGVSLESGSFIQTQESGFKDIIRIQFSLGEGKEAPAAVAGQIDPILFQTTVELR